MAAMYEDDEPELTGYEPHEKALRSAHLVTAMRVMVVLGLVALVLPGILITASTASRTAVQACMSSAVMRREFSLKKRFCIWIAPH